jgi:hypothetical protein
VHAYIKRAIDVLDNKKDRRFIKEYRVIYEKYNQINSNAE